MENKVQETKPPFRMAGSKALVDRRLKTEELQPEYDKIRHLEPLITEDVRAVTSHLGTKCAGLQYAVKTASSMENRLQREKKKSERKRKLFHPVSFLHELGDTVRYTELCEHEKLVPMTRKTIAEMQKRGYTLTKLINFYQHPFPETGYMGIHLNFISQYGQPVELQVHSPESFQAKQEGHVYYEKIRSVSSKPSVKQVLIGKVQKIHHSVPKPPEYEALTDYKMPSDQVHAVMEERRKAIEIHSETMFEDVRRPETGEKEAVNVEMFTVAMNGKTLLSGQEEHYKDGSANAYRRYANGIETEESFTRHGDSIAVTYGRQHDRPKTMTELLAKAEQVQRDHDVWMQEHFPNGEHTEPEEQRTEHSVSDPSEHKTKRMHDSHDSDLSR